MNEEGGDMGEIIERVRAQTLAMREQAIEEYEKGNTAGPGDSSSGDDKSKAQ